GIVAALGAEQPVRREPRQSETGREQIPPRHRPEHLAGPLSSAGGSLSGSARETGGERGEEQGGRGIVARRGARRRRLVQRREQPAARKPVVHLLDPEGQSWPDRARRSVARERPA